MLNGLNESNFLIYAMNNYDNVHCVSLEEFKQDLQRFLYLNKLFNRYKIDNKDLKERLLVNHIIILNNLFGKSSIDMLFYKIDKKHWESLSTILKFLGLLSSPHLYEGIDVSSLNPDKYLLEKLNLI